MEAGHRSVEEEAAHHPEEAVEAQSQTAVAVAEGFRQSHSSGREGQDQVGAQREVEEHRSREHHRKRQEHPWQHSGHSRSRHIHSQHRQDRQGHQRPKELRRFLRRSLGRTTGRHDRLH